MPWYVESGYGFGEAICKASNFIRWGGDYDCDAVVCTTMFGIPVSASKTIHTYDWNGNSFQSIPIRWSNMLVLKAMLRRWLSWFVVVGVLLFLFSAINLFDQRPGMQHLRIILLPLGVSLIGISGAAYWCLSAVDQRSRNIRWVLGPHDFGSSDPATWTEAHQTSMAGPRDLYGTDSYSEAVLPLLEAGEFAQAMWAARFTVLAENRFKGEELTHAILKRNEVRAAIYQVQKDPSCWREVMNPPDTATT